MGLDFCYRLAIKDVWPENSLRFTPKIWRLYVSKPNVDAISAETSNSHTSGCVLPEVLTVLVLPATIMLTIQRLVRLQPLISLPASRSVQSQQRLLHLLISHHPAPTLPPAQSTLHTRPGRWRLQDKTDKGRQFTPRLQHHCSFSILVSIVVWPLENSDTDHLEVMCNRITSRRMDGGSGACALCSAVHPSTCQYRLCLLGGARCRELTLLNGAGTFSPRLFISGRGGTHCFFLLIVMGHRAIRRIPIMEYERKHLTAKWHRPSDREEITHVIQPASLTHAQHICFTAAFALVVWHLCFKMCWMSLRLCSHPCLLVGRLGFFARLFKICLTNFTKNYFDNNSR